MVAIFTSALPSHAAPPAETIALARSLREKGDFNQAEAALTAVLKTNDATLSANERRQLRHELDLLAWTRQDFSYDTEKLFHAINKAVVNLTRTEFDGWLKEGRFESRRIDGETRFPGTSASNLFWRYPELNPRRRTPRDKSAYYRELLENSRAIRKAAAQEKSTYVLPTRFKLTMTVTAEAKAAPAGQIIRAWLPIPRQYPYPFQEGFKLLSSSPSVKSLAEATSPIRSVYLEQPAQPGQDAKFQISYEHATRARRFELNPEESKPLPDDPSLQPFLHESPHAIFTEKIKKLGSKIVGSEKNPVRRAKAIFDWIGEHVRYSYSLEYSTIPNISDYVLDKGWGDCGQQALLFITLCRSQGIPARWQSGWYLFPGSKNIHDWAEIYLAPWGWVPADAEFGNAVLRYAINLPKADRQELHDFYFGGLDQYRMAANSDHAQELQPPKKNWRSDDVDFQRGELESGDHNIFFNQYDYDMEIDYLTPK